MKTEREAAFGQLDSKPSPAPGISSFIVLMGRLMWFIIGPAVLTFITVGIVTRGPGWLSARNAFYWVCVLLMIAGRRREQSSGCATLATGDPASWQDYQRYVRILMPLTAVIWLIANVLGNHLLNRAG